MTLLTQEDSNYLQSSTRPELSFRQKAILTFIYDYTRLVGQAPSLREMADAVGITSSSHISYHIDRLLRWGLIGRVPSSWRSVILLQPGYDIIDKQSSDETQVILSELRNENRRLREWCEQLHQERDHLHEQLEQLTAQAS